jgi:hypothetical protein
MLEILSAFYGPIGNTKEKADVTDQIRQLVSSDKKSISVLVGSKGIGVEDKSPETPKELTVRYSIDGGEIVETLRDGKMLKATVPEPAPQTATVYALSLYGIMWRQAISALFVFLAAVSIGMAFNLGFYVLNPIVWVVVAIIVPYGSFWIIPIVLILIRIFSSQDFIIPTGGRRR